MGILKYKYKAHRLVNCIFYVGIFIFGFLLGFTVKKIDFSEIVSQVLFIDSASAETLTTCRDSLNEISYDDSVSTSNGLTFTYDNNMLTIKGTSTAWTQTLYRSLDITLDTDYIYSTELIGSCDGISSKLAYEYNEQSYYPTVNNDNVILNTGTHLIQTYYIVDNGVTVDCTIKAQLQKGTIVTPWEEPGVQICEDDDNFYNFANEIVGELEEKDYWVYDFVTLFLVSVVLVIMITTISFIIKKIINC